MSPQKEIVPVPTFLLALNSLAGDNEPNICLRHNWTPTSPTMLDRWLLPFCLRFARMKPFKGFGRYMELVIRKCAKGGMPKCAGWQ